MLQVSGSTLNEAILQFKSELESKMTAVDKYPIKIINGEKYINIDGEWSPLLEEVVVTGKAIANVRAFVIAPKGIRLHSIPMPNSYDDNSRIYKPGEEVLFVKKVKNAKGWAYIKTKDGKFGYIQRVYLVILRENTSIDRYTKKYHFVKENEAFETIIRNDYSGYKVSTGNDYRTIAQAFKLLNETSRHNHGIYFEKKEKNIGERAIDTLKDVHDPWMQEARSIYEEIRLTKHKIVRLPNKAYIDKLKELGTINVRPEILNKGIDLGYGVIDVVAGTAGFVVGVVEGFLVAIWEALEGIIDLISQVASIVKKLFSGELLEDLKKLYETLVSLNKDELWELAKGLLGSVGTAIQKMLNEWDKLSTFEQARIIGKIVGAIILEIILAVFTGGTATAAKWAGKAGKVGEVAMKIAKFGDKVKDKVSSKIPKKYKNRKKKNDYNDENDPKNLQRQLLLNQARVTAEAMDVKGNTIEELVTTLNLTEKVYPKLGDVKWPVKHIRKNIYSIGMVASPEKSVDGHFTSGKDGENKRETKIKGDVDFEHERVQAIKYGDRKGGGIIEFGDSKRGIEGYFISEKSGVKIPISFKTLITEKPINVFREIRQNAKKVKKEAVDDINIKIGKEVNTEIHVILENMKKKDLLEFIENSKPNIFPEEGVFNEIVIETSDGLLVFNKNGKMID